ncbi:hypothetical protein C0992_009631 [Termitomyces sp. T32_za158]|nr:hypothetical protein C0992_009631 [Termitomyces sp. T32_za158]
MSAKATSAELSAANKPPVFGDLTCDPATQTTIEKPWASPSVPYSFLAHTLSALAQTRSRITITNILTNCLHCIIRYDSQALLSAIYLLSSTLAPPYTSLELGLGPSIIFRCIQNVSGLTAQALKRLVNSTGDPGDVAFAAKSNLRTLLPHPPLLVNYVYASLLKISRCRGQGTAKEKEKIVEKLLLAATGEEIRFLTRTLAQNLRVGAVRATILLALSRAMVLTPSTHLNDKAIEPSLHVTTELLENYKPTTGRKRGAVDPASDVLAAKFGFAESLIKRVYVQHPNYEDIVMALLQGGLDSLEEKVRLTIGIPLHPTLGSPTRSLEEVYDVCQTRPFVAEFKYDGQRAQIHGSREGDKILVSLFSRHLEDMTSKYPDVVQYVITFFNDHPETTSFILDTEIVPIGPGGGLRSFQDLSSRARKDVRLQDVQVFVSILAFDLMYLNGEPDSIMLKAVQLLDNEPIQGATTLDKAAKPRRKPLPATYEPDKRTSAWLKLKKDYVTGFGDTLDMIPIGAWYGNGRKAQWWSPILLGLWQPDCGRIVAVCKCMSGFTDAFYKDIMERYSLSGTSGLTSYVSQGFTPEVYFKPMEVWEIRGADITLSPVSVAAKGLVNVSRGLSIRFPRFTKVREDKSIEQANTPIFLAKLWRRQEAKDVKRNFDDEGELIHTSRSNSN